MNCKECRRWFVNPNIVIPGEPTEGKCLVSEIKTQSNQVCNAWELSQVAEWKEENEKLIASNTKLEEFVNELIETGRIKLVSNDELPEAKESVLALVKEKWSGELYIERACYIPPKSIRADDFFLDDLEDESVEEYDEELDLYWVAEGWWEDSHEANVNWKITGEVIGWWSLPKIEVEG